jgi:acetyl-CoA carboxylase carboxyl transferase subunit alpha
MRSYLDFEKPVMEIEAKLEELRTLETGDSAAAIGEEIGRLQARRRRRSRISGQPYPWQKTMVARHHERPRTADYIAA